MSEREHGWPEDYNWPEYLSGQMAKAKWERAEEILLNEIAMLEDEDEQRRALKAWRALRAGTTQKAGEKLQELGAYDGETENNDAEGDGRTPGDPT